MIHELERLPADKAKQLLPLTLWVIVLTGSNFLDSLATVDDEPSDPHSAAAQEQRLPERCSVRQPAITPGTPKTLRPDRTV